MDTGKGLSNQIKGVLGKNFGLLFSIKLIKAKVILQYILKMYLRIYSDTS